MPLPHAGLLFKVLFMLKSLTLPFFRIVIGWWKCKELSWYHFRELLIAWLTFPFEILILIPHTIRNVIGLVSRRHRLVFKAYEPARYIHVDELFEENLKRTTSEVFRSSCRWVRKSWSIHADGIAQNEIRIYPDKHVREGTVFYYISIPAVRLIKLAGNLRLLKSLVGFVSDYHETFRKNHWFVMEFDSTCYKVYGNPRAWKSKSHLLVSRDKSSQIRIFLKHGVLYYELSIDDHPELESEFVTTIFQ